MLCKFMYLSFICICSNMADPVFAFQLPDIDFLLYIVNQKNIIYFFSFVVTVINCVAWCIFSSNSLSFLHEGLVISSYFLYVDVELSVNIRFGCRVTIGDSDDAGDVLEVIVIFYLHLERKCQYLSRLSISAR